MNDCYNSSNTFDENGYLTTTIEIPKTSEELFSDYYVLTYLLAKLAITLYGKQKFFMK